MNTKIQEDKWCGMRKLAKNSEYWLFSQNWKIRNTSSILPIQDKKGSASSMNELYEMLYQKILGEENNGTRGKMVF
jgi:hypothetical protein